MSLQFLPNLLIPRAPKPGAQVEDLIQWCTGAASALEQFRQTLEAQTESFIASSASIGDLVVVTGHIQDLSVTTAKINSAAITTAKIDDLAVVTAKIDNLTVTTIKRQYTNQIGPTTYATTAGGNYLLQVVTGVNGNTVNYGVWPQGVSTTWSSGTYLGIGSLNVAVDIWGILFHNGMPTATTFNYYFEYW